MKFTESQLKLYAAPLSESENQNGTRPLRKRITAVW